MIILDICSNADVLKILRIVKIVLLILRIAGPVTLILSLMIHYLRAVKDNDSDALIKANKTAVPKIIAAIILFLIPTFVNIIASIVGYNSETYLSCIDYATIENIDAAYAKAAIKAVDNAKSTLKESDYNYALNAINKISNESTKKDLINELSEVKIYFEVSKAINSLKNNFSREKYKEITDKIESIKDSVIKEKLKKLLSDTIGAYGTLAMYDINPSSKLYKNTRPLQDITLKELLIKNGSSVEKLNLQMREAVEMVGVGTREAPVAAAMVLHETLAGYGYHLYYRWGGKHNHVGVNASWGKNIGSTSLCSSHPDPAFCTSSFKYSGLDCSGFVNWALAQGFQSTNIPSHATTHKGAISLVGASKAICNVGDTLVNDVHITLVAKLDDKNKRYIILEDTGSHGMRLSTVPYNTNSYWCGKVSYKN